MDHEQWSQFRSKPLTIVHGFRPVTVNFDFGKKMISCKSIVQGGQNGTNFSFIAPSSEE